MNVSRRCTSIADELRDEHPSFCKQVRLPKFSGAGRGLGGADICRGRRPRALAGLLSK
jgi:hypothetical protein